jgi:hypothetical protein
LSELGFVGKPGIIRQKNPQQVKVIADKEYKVSLGI